MAPSGQLKVDPNELKAQAAKLSGASQDLQTKLTNALKRLNGLGNFWGDDKTGHTFHDGEGGHPGYGSQHDNVTAEADAIIKGYGQIVSGLEQMAKNVDIANWNALVALPKVPQ
jgi:uncharacterized protein YukE